MDATMQGTSDDKIGEESIRICPHPVESYVIGSEEEKQHIEEGVTLGNIPGFKGNPSFDAGMSDAELAGEVVDQVELISGITGMKRKSETAARACDGDTALSLTEDSEKKWFCSLCEVSTTSEVTLNAHFLGKKHKAKEVKSKSHDLGSSMDIDAADKPKRLVEPDSTLTSGQENSKWECLLCQLSVSSETLLKSHLQGKKHKAKEAKLQTGQSISSLEECSTEKTGELTDHSGDVNATDVINKWYCSLCEVSASSENNLNDHLQGKKHKAKVALVPHDTADLNSRSIETLSEAVKIMKKEKCNGGENAKEEQQTKCPSTKVGKDDTSGQELTELEANRNSALQATADANELESVKVDVNRQETSFTASQATEDTEKQGNQRREFVKYWHCKLCNKGTADEATMTAHRKSDEHKALLRKNGGGLICVSNVLKEASHVVKASVVTSS